MNILQKLESLRHREHTATVDLVAALLECKRSGAHLDAGYASIWDFLVRRLRYSNAAASRRYKAMKCAEVCPVALTMLRERRTNLTVLAKVEALLSEADDPRAFLARIDGKSQVEVERLISSARPTVKLRERVELQCVELKTAAVRRGAGSPATRSSASDLFATSAKVAASSGQPAAEPRIATEDRVALRFSLEAKDYEAFERARAILSRKLPRGITLEQAFNEFVAFYLKKKEPTLRVKRPTSSEPATTAPPATRSAAMTPKPHGPTTRSRYVPAAVRDEVFTRDDQRCTYVGPGGTRCDSTHNLHLDHIEPFACGGAHDPGNLRVLCATHNQRRARLRFG